MFLLVGFPSDITVVHSDKEISDPCVFILNRYSGLAEFVAG